MSVAIKRIKRSGFYDIPDRDWIADDNVILFTKRLPGLKYNIPPESPNLTVSDIEKVLERISESIFYSARFLFSCYYDSDIREWGVSESFGAVVFLGGDESYGVVENFGVFESQERRWVYDQRYLNLAVRVFDGGLKYSISNWGILKMETIGLISCTAGYLMYHEDENNDISSLLEKSKEGMIG